MTAYYNNKTKILNRQTDRHIYCFNHFFNVKNVNFFLLRNGFFITKVTNAFGKNDGKKVIPYDRTNRIVSNKSLIITYGV